MRARATVAIVAALCAIGCKSRQKLASTNAASSTSASTTSWVSAPNVELSAKPSIGAPPFAATLEGKPLVFESAWIVGTTYGWLFLSTGSSTCSLSAADDPNVTRLEVDLHAGPDDRLYAGHPIGVAVSIDPLAQKKKYAESWIGSPFATLTIDADATWSKGAHVRGTLEFTYDRAFGARVLRYEGSGAFDAVVCDEHGEGWWGGGPSSVDAHAVEGAYGEATMETKSALAFVMHDDTNHLDYVETLRFYPTEVDCDRRAEMEKTTPYLQLSGPVAGANARQRFVGTAQPASFFYVTPSEGDAETTTHAIDGDGWVRVDRLELDVGGEVRGELFVESAKGESAERRGKFSGNFRAKVCRG